MKKIVLLSCLIFATLMYAQNNADNLYDYNDLPNIPNIPKEFTPGLIYYDAVKLATDTLDVIEILKFYKVNLDSNIFLKEYFYKYKELIKDSAATPSGGSISLIGNTDVTYFATGLSRFLADRAKAELSETFFAGMKKTFEKDTVLKTVFPQTSIILEYIENYGYAYVFQVLKNAFETDMRNLSYNLYALKYSNNTNSQRFFTTLEGKWLALALSTVNTAKTVTNPAGFLNSLTKTTDFTTLKDTLFKTKNPGLNVLSFVELNNLISQSLLSYEKNQVWIRPEQLDTLLRTKVFKIYLGLLLAKQQKGDNIVFYKNDSITTTFASILIKGYEKPEQFATLIRNAYSVYRMGNNAVKELVNNKQDTVVSPQALYEFYRTAIDAVRPVAYGIAAVDPTLNPLKLDRIEKLLNPAVDLVYHIAVKQYSAAVFDAVILLDSLGKDKMQSLIKYGTLVANVAGAQSSDEVKQAIEASTLPVGSSAMKRNSKWSIMLNAYVGGYYGYSCKKDTLSALHSYGLYAPIGFSISKGFKKCGALSLSLNVLDLGSLVNVYLKDGDNAVLPNDFKVRLVDIISPGAQLSYLLGSTPLTFFVGTNYVPKLYPISGNSFKSGWRWQVGVAIDIPMYKIGLW